MNAVDAQDRPLFRAYTVVTFERQGSGTRLQVTQDYTLFEGFAAPMIQGGACGWSGSLDRLQAGGRRPAEVEAHQLHSLACADSRANRPPKQHVHVDDRQGHSAPLQRSFHGLEPRSSHAGNEIARRGPGSRALRGRRSPPRVRVILDAFHIAGRPGCARSISRGKPLSIVTSEASTQCFGRRLHGLQRFEHIADAGNLHFVHRYMMFFGERAHRGSQVQPRRQTHPMKCGLLQECRRNEGPYRSHLSGSSVYLLRSCAKRA